MNTPTETYHVYQFSWGAGRIKHIRATSDAEAIAQFQEIYGFFPESWMVAIKDMGVIA